MTEKRHSIGTEEIKKMLAMTGIFTLRLCERYSGLLEMEMTGEAGILRDRTKADPIAGPFARFPPVFVVERACRWDVNLT